MARPASDDTRRSTDLRRGGDQLVLTLRLVFHLALRQAEGFARSVLRLLGLDVRIPDHSTLSRRGHAFAGRQPRAARHDEPEPRRVCRRLVSLSHAAMARVSSSA